MKILSALGILFLNIGTHVEACPSFKPWETRPDTVRIIYQKIKVFKNSETGLIWARINPRKYFNSVAFRFPKGLLDKAGFTLELSHQYYDENNEWGPSYRYQSVGIAEDEHYVYPTADQSQVYFTGDDCFHFYLKQNTGMALDSFEIEIILQYVPPFEDTLDKPISSRGLCTEPPIISQQVWRAGLPPPVKGRNSTLTEHCIVHHSASGNGDTAYTDLVRSYYTFHTQVNGWDDIGYNYLIAANGWVYAGRDPEKVGIHQDDVQGAHFCAKNSGTMGVCMIGDFTNQKPKTPAMESLYQLLGWKVKKDSLNPFASYPHPAPSDLLLNVLAGHRDGCATVCPGDSLYALLNIIRSEAAECAVVSGINEKTTKLITIYNTENGWNIENIQVGITVDLLDLAGRKIYSSISQLDGELTIPFNGHGVFLLQVNDRLWGLSLFKVMH